MENVIWEAFWKKPAYCTEKLLTNGVYDGVVGTYCAFPSLTEDGEQIRVAFKHGKTHYQDPGVTRMIVMTRAGEIVSDTVAYAVEDKNTQNAELLTLPDKTVRMYIDIQTLDVVSRGREGARELFFDGKNFVEREGLLTDSDGIVYGYVFDGVSFAGAYHILAMSFPETNGNRMREVNILTLMPDGSYKNTLSVTKAVGADINESAFVVMDDVLYVSVRGYQNADNSFLLALDSDFRVKNKVRHTEKEHAVAVIGRPKLFVRDGGLYLIMRNTREGHAMELAMAKIDPATLLPTAGVLLYPENPHDGFYAEPYFDVVDGETYLRVVTYRGSAAGDPDIVLLSYKWEEVK